MSWCIRFGGSGSNRRALLRFAANAMIRSDGSASAPDSHICNEREFKDVVLEDVVLIIIYST